MENKIQIFENPDFGQVRTTTGENGEILFVGNDVAKALGYKDEAQAVRDYCKGVVILTTPSAGGPQKMKYITEADVYRLVMRSKLPNAEAFQDWVCEVVLPQIRKTGGYIPVQENDDDKTIMAKAMLIMQRTIEQQKAKLAEQKPEVEFAEAVSSCEDSILIRDLAKLITQNGVKIGQARLFYWLRLHNYIFQQSTRPIQKWVEEGIFDTQVQIFYTNHGHQIERCTTKVTGKGQRYFIDGFLSGRFHAENGNF